MLGCERLAMALPADCDVGLYAWLCGLKAADRALLLDEEPLLELEERPDMMLGECVRC